MVAFFGFLAGCSSKKHSTEVNGAPQIVGVSTAQAIGRQVPVTLSETGSFVAEESSDVAPAVAGIVISTPAAVGSFVKKGDVLCSLDHSDAASKIEQSKAQLAEAAAGVRQAESRIGLIGSNFDVTMVPEVAAAKANYESALAQARLAVADAKRYANLLSTGDVSQSVYEKQRTQADTAAAQANASKQQYEAAVNTAHQSYIAISSSQATLENVRAQVAQAEKALSDTTIRAPFDGYVSDRPVAVGEYVTTSSKVATVVRIGTLKLEMQVPEKDAAALTVKMVVTARVAAYGNRDFQGMTAALNPAINPQSRAFVLEARFDNAGNALRPGMFATARVALAGMQNAVYVPQSTVIRDRTTDSNQIFVIEGGKAHLRVVTLGDADDGVIRIMAGVNAGDTVATNKQSELYDGASVNGPVAR